MTDVHGGYEGKITEVQAKTMVGAAARGGTVRGSYRFTGIDLEKVAQGVEQKVGLDLGVEQFEVGGHNLAGVLGLESLFSGQVNLGHGGHGVLTASPSNGAGCDGFIRIRLASGSALEFEAKYDLNGNPAMFEHASGLVVGGHAELKVGGGVPTPPDNGGGDPGTGYSVEGPITVRDRRLYAGSVQFFPICMTSWTAHTLGQSTKAKFLDAVKALGFNSIITGRSMISQDFEGMVQLVDMAADRGLWVCTGLGAFELDKNRPWKPSQVIPTGVVRQTVRNRARVLARRPNVWCIFADSLDVRDQGIDNNLVDYLTVEALNGIAEGAPGVLCTVHPEHGITSGGVGNQSFVSLHSGHSAGRDPEYVKKLYVNEQYGSRPVFNTEPCYEGNPDVTAVTVSRVAAVDVACGIGVVCGHLDIACGTVGMWNALRVDNPGPRLVVQAAATAGYPTLWFKKG